MEREARQAEIERRAALARQQRAAAQLPPPPPPPPESMPMATPVVPLPPPLPVPLPIVVEQSLPPQASIKKRSRWLADLADDDGLSD